MHSPEIDSHLQVAAALGLLECSRLVQWRADELKFSAVERERFESAWRNEVHPVFGRLICWISFSAGAELLAKGACLANGIEVRHPHNVPVYPQSDLDAWANNFLKDYNCAGTAEVPHFGELRHLVYDGGKKGNKPAYLRQLCQIKKASEKDEKRILAAYILLAKSVRNRDAHAYIPNVRDQHQFLVPALFTEVFNLLACWLPGGRRTLNRWRDEAKSLIDMLG